MFKSAAALMTGALLGFGFFASSARAEVTRYKVSTTLSRVEFTAAQNGSPLKGEFPVTGGTVSYDADHPEGCSADVSVSLDVGGAAGAAADIAETLISPDWLDSKARKSARFTSTRFARAQGGGYILEGNLDLKGVVKPVKADAEIVSVKDGKLIAKATFRLDRLQFNVGWAETDNVSAETKVDAFIVAEAVK